MTVSVKEVVTHPHALSNRCAVAGSGVALSGLSVTSPIYETLIAQTRPLWLGMVAGQGAVLEHLEYRSGVMGYRALLGPQASRPYDDIDSAVAWLSDRDPSLPINTVRTQARSLDTQVTMTACGTGTYYILSGEAEAAEIYLVPMVLTPERIRVDANTMLWHNGIGTINAPDNGNSPPQGAEFTTANLPFVLNESLRAPLKTSWDAALTHTPVVNANLILLQRYARHDAIGLTQFLHDYMAI